MVYVHWKSLTSLGVAFWIVLWFTDLLGESTWKRYSQHLEDILTSYFEEVSKMQLKKSQLSQGDQKVNWWLLFCNICAFLCSLIFCSFVKSTTWVVWNVFVSIRNFYQTKTSLKDAVVSSAGTTIKELAENAQNITVANCKVLFKNRALSSGVIDRLNKRQSETDPIEHLKKVNSELLQRLIAAEEENLAKCKQLEEIKIESTLMREKLKRNAETLNQNTKNKDFLSASQEMIAVKTRTLEMQLKDVSRDRDLLKNKLSSMEKTCKKLDERVKSFEMKQQVAHLKDVSEIPEKDENVKSISDAADSEVHEAEVDMTKFQTRLMELQRNINNFSVKATHSNSNTNSKISMDLDESSNDTSKDNEQEEIQEERLFSDEQDKADMANVTQSNLLNYNIYKAQMMRSGDSSSSDEPSSPKRIISSTLEFQNFLKTLNTNSNASYAIIKKNSV